MRHQYKRVEIDTLQGLKQAERLHQSGWKTVSSSWWSIVFEKAIPTKPSLIPPKKSK